MKENQIQTVQQARNYLFDVLSNWTEFCSLHPLLTKSLSIVLNSSYNNGRVLVEHFMTSGKEIHLFVDSDYTDEFEEMLHIKGRKVKFISYGYRNYQDYIIYEV